MYENCLLSNPQVVCDLIINQVKNAGMNFHLVETPFSLKLSIKKSPIKINPVNLDPNANQKYSFPPPGYPISQACPQVKVPPTYDIKYCELTLELDSLESTNIALEKELESKSKTAEDVEHANIELEKDLEAFKTENNLLKEETKDLEFDLKKSKRDYLELTKKVACQHNEYQEKLKEIELDRTVVEKRNFKKEEKKAKKQAKREQKTSEREQKANESEHVVETEFRCDEREENNGVNFTCTICAKFCDIIELSAKSVPEEHDACKACNVEDDSLTVPSNTANIEPVVNESYKTKSVVNVVHYFWNGDLYVNRRLAIDYINMSSHANHDCDECSYISVMNKGVTPGGTGGWSMQFCKKFNFKLGDPLREPPYILGSLPLT